MGDGYAIEPYQLLFRPCDLRCFITGVELHYFLAAQKYGVKAMMLNWRDFFFDLTPYADTYTAKMTNALSEVRQVFEGKVLLYDVRPNGVNGAPIYNGVDAIIPLEPTGILTAAENQNLDFGTAKAAYKLFFAQMAQRYAPFSTPLVLSTLIQSHRNFLQTGWGRTVAA